MPKKSTRNNKVIRRTNWKPNSIKRKSDDKRIVNNIYIGAGNARRWIILKKKLDYQSDIDFVAYLLDLAEPLSGKNKSASPGKDQEGRDDDPPSGDFEEETNDSTSSVQQEVSDDGDWRPAGSHADGPLRRSPRKQTLPLKIQVRRSARNILPDSSFKFDKDKVLQKEKKKKKEKSEGSECVLSEGSSSDEKQEILDTDEVLAVEVHTKADSQINLVKEESGMLQANDVENVREPLTENILPQVSTQCLDNSVTDISQPETSQEVEESWREQEDIREEETLVAPPEGSAGTVGIELVEEGKSLTLIRSPGVIQETGVSQVNQLPTPICEREEGSEKVHIEVGERVKLKRRKKRRSHEDHDGDLSGEHSHSNKHKRKKHKHGEHSTKKKYHDIRKAPQDGIPQEVAGLGEPEVGPACPLPEAQEEVEEEAEEAEAEAAAEPLSGGSAGGPGLGPNGALCKQEQPDPWALLEEGPKCVDTNLALAVAVAPCPELPQPQPLQRVAIKIKLCCDCNARHVQDACPLFSPVAMVCDSVILKQWEDRARSARGERTTVVVECKGERALDEAETVLRCTGDVLLPDGYRLGAADEPAGPGDHKDSVRMVELGGMAPQTDGRNGFGPPVALAEKGLAQLSVTYAEASLPPCLQLRVCEPDHGPSVVTLTPIKQYTQFGPLVGQPIREMDIPDDFNMKDIWELWAQVFSDKERRYVSSMDANTSNWLRYLRPAPAREQRNVVPMARCGELYFITILELGEGEELMYWADDTTTAWSKKKMEKTNCGGCNLRFAHPLYYRMHCTLFHDPNFSLTIRKYHCKVCGTAVLGKENIMKHAAEMHDGKGAYQCQYCKKFFLRLNYLEMHRTYGCAANPQRARPLCDFCGRKFCQPQKLKVHIKRMHSDMAEVLREFQCKICLKLLGSRAALQRHMKEVHHKDIVGACTCDRCGKMFQNKSNLKIHMLTHSGVKPFRCKESGCAAAFTTKQCLQFHYKKVHNFTETNMPPIERSVAYTFDAYSGGIVNDPGRGKSPRFDKMRRNSGDNNSSSQVSQDESSSASSLKADVSANSSTTDGNTEGCQCQMPACSVCCSGVEEKGPFEGLPPLTPPPPPVPVEAQVQQPPTLEAYLSPPQPQYGSSPSKVVSKGSKKWLGDSLTPLDSARVPAPKPGTTLLVSKDSDKDMYEFEADKSNNVPEVVDDDVSIIEASNHKVSVTVYQRPESSNASLLVEAALDAAERDIDMTGTCGVVTSSVESPSVITASDMGVGKPGDVLYAMTPAPPHHLVNGHHSSMNVSSPVQHSRTPPEPHDQMDGYALHPAEDLVSPATTPDPGMHRQQHLSPETPPSGNLQHMDNYTLQRSEMVSPRSAADLNAQHHLHRPQVDPYSLHHQEELVSPADTPNPPPRPHLVDGYGLHHQEELMSPAGTPDEHRNHVDSYSMHHQEELVSPAGTPTPRYELHHHQVPTDNLSSDEGEGVVVAQNLSMGLKEKALHLDIAATAAAYKQYEALEVVQEFGRSASGERPGFEPLLVGSTTELQGLDMSARSGGYHHTFVSSSSQPMTRYHHTSVLYDMATERQSVDLSMSGRAGTYSASPPPPYSHSDILRVVSLDLTPGGRHSVDLSLPRAGPAPALPPHHHPHPHHHQLGASGRVMAPAGSPPDPRMAAPPAPPGTPNHVVPELSRASNLMSPLPAVNNQGLVEPGRIMSPPPHPGYQNYPLSPSPYHPPARTPHITSTSPSTYHHYSGYY